MVENNYRVGKTQWSKWTDEGRTAFNEARDAGATYREALCAGDVATAEAETARKDKKRGIFDVIESAIGTVATVAATVSPVVAMAKTVAKATQKKAK